MTNFLKDLFQLTKFEIVVLEIITLVAGYFIGHSMEMAFQWAHFAKVVFGVTFLAMASGAINQIQERDEDSQMDRTRNRPLPSGRASVRFATILSTVLILLGIILLSQVSWLVLGLGISAVISYNVLYTLWWKRKLAYAAIPGAIPGALPILIGYQAALPPDAPVIVTSTSGQVFAWGIHPLLDPRGIYLFAILFFWQMPHFWVLALKYSNDYDKGGFPTLPVAKGSVVTRQQIMLWCLAYSGLALLSALFFPTGIFGLTGSIAVSAWLIFELVRFLKHPEHKTWLRFFLSVNFSMILYLFIIMTDLLSIYLHPRS